MKTKIISKKMCVLFLGFLCLFVGGTYRNIQDKAEKQNMEVQAAGRFDRWENLSDSNKENCGVRLLGDKKLYPIQNGSDIFFEHGDSVFVVNQMAFANMPTQKHLSEVKTPTVKILKILFIFLAVGWLVALFSWLSDVKNDL